MNEPLVQLEDIRATYRFLAHAGRGVTEVRIIHPDRGIAGIGFFDDEEEFVQTCAEHSGEANVYAGIQPRPQRFLEKAKNRVAHLRQGARDDDIGWLTAIVVDLDPVRPKDTASTEAELALAVERGETISAWVQSKGFLPPVLNMSGNGCQLWFAVPPLEITPHRREEIKERLRQFEARIREKFGGSGVAVDSIFNLSRIIKVIGTRSVKGDDSPERPHRTSRCLVPFERREDPALLDAILRMTLRVAPPFLSVPSGDNPPPSPSAPARGPAPDPPVEMCPPARKLWEEGFQDRSVAIFAMVRYLMHVGLPVERLVPAVVEWDACRLGKLDGRDGRKYVEDCIRKIEATRGLDGAVAPPCRWLRTNGYFSPESPCNGCHVLLDVEKAILDIPADLPAAELEARLRPVLEAVADSDPSMDRRYLDLLHKRFRLGLRDLKRSVTSIRARRRREEETPDGSQAAMRGEVYEDIRGYYVENRDGEPIFISSFCIEPTTRILVEDGEIVVGDVATDRGEVFRDIRFEPAAFHSRRNFLGALRRLDLQWTGTDENLQGVQRILAGRAVPHRRGTRSLGYVETPDGPRWVGPGMVIGPDGPRSADEILYVPSGSSLDTRVRYPVTDDCTFARVAHAVFALLPQINLPEVVLPILGWFFAAPLKPRIMQRVGSFPTLFIWGTQGSGKSATVSDIFWPLHGVRDAEPYSATETEFALIKLLAATRSVPVFIDEYKPYDMPRNRLNTFHRYLRRLYRGEAEERGRPDQTVNSYHLQAPLCVAGETRPTEAALLERILTANPTKTTLEEREDCRAAFRELKTLDLPLFAARYVQFCLGRDVDADLGVAHAVAERLLAGRKVPIRVFENLAAMLLGVYLFEEFARGCGYSGLPDDLGARQAVDAVLGDVLETDHGVKNALDHFVEMLQVMAIQGELRHRVHYVFRDGILFVHLESAYDAFRKHCRTIAYEGEMVDLKALRRLLHENRRQGGYVTVENERVYFGKNANRRRAFGIDPTKTSVLDPGDFPQDEPDEDRFASGSTRWGD